MTQAEEQGNRLNTYLSYKNQTKRVFSGKIGIHPTMVSMVTNGKHEITNKVIQGLIKFYPDLNLDWLLHGRGAMICPVDTEHIGELDTPVMSLESEVFALKKEVRRIAAIVDKKKRP